MKKMRTILAMLLVFVMAVSSFTVLADEETTVTGTVETEAETETEAESVSKPASITGFKDIERGSLVEDAVKKLVNYNVISGYEDGTFKPDNTITRAEFAAVITRFKGIGSNLPEDAVTGFSDLDNDSTRAWARPYVQAAVEAGIIKGFEDGTFRAADPVTYEQAVKMIVCAVGYEPIAISEYNRLVAIGTTTVTWSSGYISAAMKNGITKGAVEANVESPAKRSTVAILTCNAYDVPELEATTTEDGKTSYNKGGGSVESDKYDEREKITGTLVANYYTSLDGEDPELEVNEIKIKVSGDDVETYEISNSLMGSINLNEFIGKKIIAYYAKDEYAIVSLDEANNSIVQIEESQVIRPFDENEISYYEGSKKRDVNVNDYTIIYNGKVGYIDDLTELEDRFTNGYIEVNSTTDVVNITSFDVMVVNSYSKNTGNGRIYLKYNDEYNGEDYFEFPSGSKNKPEIYVNGTKKEFDSLSLSSYSVINYFESPDVGGPILRQMYVTTGAKSGKVTATMNEERLVELNNEEFYLTNDYYEYEDGGGSNDKKAPFEMGDNYSYYLDYTGQIAAINYNAAAQSNLLLGYVCYIEEDVISIIKKDGNYVEYTLKDKVKFDGESIKANKVKDALEDVAELELIDSLEQEEYCQPIKYSLSSGEVSIIDTVATDKGGNNDMFCVNELYTGDKVKPTTTSVKINGNTYSLSSSTVIMYVPDDRTSVEEYAVMTASKAFASTTAKQIEVFGADVDSKVKVPSLILVYGQNPSHVMTGSSPCMVVTKGLTGEKITGFIVGETEPTKRTVSESTFYVDTDMGWVRASDVEEGDLIRLLEGKNKEIVAIEMIYDASEGEENLNLDCEDIDEESDGLMLHEKDGNDLYVYYAMAFEKNSDENKIYVSTSFGEGEDASDDMNTVSVNNSTAYYHFDGSDLEYSDSMEVVETDEEPMVIYIRSGSATAAAKMFYVLK